MHSLQQFSSFLASCGSFPPWYEVWIQCSGLSPVRFQTALLKYRLNLATKFEHLGVQGPTLDKLYQPSLNYFTLILAL